MAMSTRTFVINNTTIEGHGVQVRWRSGALERAITRIRRMFPDDACSFVYPSHSGLSAFDYAPLNAEEAKRGTAHGGHLPA
jgi:hypothetical protein